MKLITWDIDSGGREQIDNIIDKIHREDCDIAVITGFRTNHNKNKILNSLKDIGYNYIVYRRPAHKHQDTVLVASKEDFIIEKNDCSKRDSFLIISQNDINIAAMNFTNNINQKELMNLFKEELSEYIDKKLIVAGNMQTAKNYATKNSLGKKLCKRYIDFKDVNLKNCIEQMASFNPDNYTWSSRKGGEYNVDFILMNEKMDEHNFYCYYNHDVKESGISSHSMILLNIA